MARAVFLVLLLALCRAQVKDDNDKTDSDLAKLLEEIFGKPSTTPLPAPEVSAPPMATDKTEETVVNTISQCRTADGRDGQCSLPSGCAKRLLPTRRGDKSNCTGIDEVCCAFEDISLSGVDPSAVASNGKVGCGWRNSDGIRILSADSDKTEFAEFPWIVAVLTILPQDLAKPEGSKVYLYTCGGSIIHPRVVMTAAHNVHAEGISLRVRAGEWDTNSMDEALPYQDRNVQSIIIHEQYNIKRKNLFYDIALLVLEKPLDLVFNVNPICLPPAGQRAVDGTKCFSSGWGKNKFGKGGSYQTILKKVEIPVIDRSKCQRELRKTRLGPLFKLHDSFMCAGGEENKDTCTGDGGSPLMCPVAGQSGRYVASGMVAWGLGCGDAVPAVYADVSTLRTWVDMKMLTLGLSPESYTY